MTEKSDDDNIDGCNDNYVINDKILKIMMKKNYQKTINYYDF